MIENAPKKRGRPRLVSINYPPLIIYFKEIKLGLNIIITVICIILSF
jgi:hypothetical protein